LRVLRNLAAVLFILAIPVALVTTNIRFVANEPAVYRYAIDQFDGVERTGIAREELLRGSAELRRYFNSNEEPLNIRVERQGREISLFNPSESDHLRDVKVRLRWMNRVQEASVLFILAYVACVVLWAREISPRRLAVQAAIGAGATLAAVALAAIMAMSGFDQAWEGFHEAIFSGNWRFNTRTDHLIQMFPPSFWQSIVFFIGLLIVAEAALLLVAAGLYIGVSGRQHTTPTLTPNYA
jgi:integral membrane protein (TIGR01906 family)